MRETLITAMSDSASCPTTVADAELPSLKMTDAFPVPPATTWSFVITCPSALAMKPEPSLVPPRPATRTVTTLGSTRSATPASDSGGRWASVGAAPGTAPSTVAPAPPRIAKA